MLPIITYNEHTCFIGKFGGHSNNLAPVLAKTNSLGPPRGPKESARAENPSGDIWVATAWMHIVSKTGHNLFYFESLV